MNRVKRRVLLFHPSSFSFFSFLRRPRAGLGRVRPMGRAAVADCGAPGTRHRGREVVHSETPPPFLPQDILGRWRDFSGPC